MSSAPEEIDFIPKKVIQQEEFLQKYPKYDGRGSLIAIIDSGINVSLDGLQKTSTGLPKILDCFDFSGVEDVDTSMIRKTEKENTLNLLSGKEIKIPQNWKNPSKVWHLGIKTWKKMNPKMLVNNDSEDDEEKSAFKKMKLLQSQKKLLKT